MSAIFMSVPRALHFAYLIQAYPNAPESIMAKVLRWHVEDCDVWEPRRARTVDFSGLNALEVRAECAGIRAHVERLLPELECAVIHARYGLTDYVDDANGDRRFFFDKERSDAIQFIATAYAMPLFDAEKQAVLDLLVARIFASRRLTPITLRAIADTFGKSHTHYRRIANKLESQLMLVENRALDALGDVFSSEHHGVSIS